MYDSDTKQEWLDARKAFITARPPESYKPQPLTDAEIARMPTGDILQFVCDVQALLKARGLGGTSLSHMLDEIDGVFALESANAGNGEW